jgi:transposase
MASECARADVVERRRYWLRYRLSAIKRCPARVTFIDETSVNTKMVRLRGRSKDGTRLQGSAPFGHWVSQTFIAGLKCDQLEQLLSSLNHWPVIFHCSINKLSRNFDPIGSKRALVTPWVIEGSMDRAVFDTYVEHILAPTLGKGDVVILDNLAVHKSAKAAAILKQRGAWFLFLPPYSPDLNPIEMAFTKLKALLRKAAARTFDDLFKALGNICNQFPETECWNFFKTIGYVS